LKSTKKVLELLKYNGESTAKMLAAELNLTTMGVRQHLLLLEEQEKVVFFDKKAARGRPTRYWKLTPESNTEFVNNHQELTLQLIDSIKVVFGQEGLDNLIEQREKDASAHYHKILDAEKTLENKINALANLRSDEGYMATVEVENGIYWIMENHCPICAAATKCLNFCRSELNLFEELMSEVATVTREEHIIEGARRCAYRIAPVAD